MDEKQQTFLEMTLSEFEMNLLDLPELSIIIHYRKDCEDREFNLKTILNFIDSNFTVCDIILVNDDKEFDKSLKSLIPGMVNNLKILFVENADEFMKSYSFNMGAEHATGSILAFWDVDVLIDPKHIQTAYEVIEEGKFDHIYPFNGTFIDVQKDKFQLCDFQPKSDMFETFYKMWKDRHESFQFASGSSPGGCNLISRKAFERMGGYDDRFIGWGFEDTDFRERSLKFNSVQTINADDAICWHLHHENAKRTENPYFTRNMQIYNQNTLK